MKITDESLLCALRGRIQKQADRCGGAYILSRRLGIRISTLTKIIRSVPVAGLTYQKVEGRLAQLESQPLQVSLEPLQGELSLSPAMNGRAKRLLRVWDRYKKCRTLQKTAAQMRVSRERVRQLLSQGARMGLFVYTPREFVEIDRNTAIAQFENISRDSLLDLYADMGSKQKVARKLKIRVYVLQKLIAKHEITDAEFRGRRLLRLKNNCVLEFERVCSDLGHNATTTDLQKLPGRGLYSRIVRHWGSIDTFREDLNLPKPPQGNPRFREVGIEQQERRRQMMQIVRQDVDQNICVLLSQHRELALVGLISKSGYKSRWVEASIKRLLASGKILRRQADRMMGRPYMYFLSEE